MINNSPLKTVWTFGTILLLGASSEVCATSLSLGADYLLRGVSIKEREKSLPDNSYYDQRLQAYLTTDLSEDVEAAVRIQSINPWGLERSTTSIVSRYPDANGSPWIQHAYVRLPKIWDERVIVTVGRQPLLWGDGKILSDDELGVNALRAQVQSPWRWLPIDLDGFSAKIEESLQQDTDTDLNGLLLGFNKDYVRWEVMGLWEKSSGQQPYEMGAETTTFTATNIA